MKLISNPAALQNPALEVPPVPPAQTGIAWLRATVGRFTTGADHARRRALSVALLATIPPATLHPGNDHPVTVLARALGVPEKIDNLIREAAQAYQPGTGDEERAGRAVDKLVEILGGTYDEPTAARIGILVQACDATAKLIAGVRHRPVEEVLHDDPPVPATRRRARTATTVDGMLIEAGEVVLVSLAGGNAFGAGERRCPGERHALALAAGSTWTDTP